MELKKYNTPIKQVIVVRKDLKNSKGEKVHTGKLISSGAHASLKVFIDRGEIFNDAEGDFIQIPLTASMKYWLLNKFNKITLSVSSEEELLDIYERRAVQLIQINIIRPQPPQTCFRTCFDMSRRKILRHVKAGVR